MNSFLNCKIRVLYARYVVSVKHFIRTFPNELIVINTPYVLIEFSTCRKNLIFIPRRFTDDI